jgi:chromosome segregation ATPase
VSEANLPTSQEVLASEDGLVGSPIDERGEGDRRRLQQAYRELTVELAQTRSLTRNQMERIWQLEQALDETSKISDELKRQLVEQGFLERQLATTEEISNIQQQAIVQLRQKLVVLEQKVGEAQERDQAYQGMLNAAETFAKNRQTDLLLQLPGSGGEAEINQLQQQLADLEAQLAKRTATQVLLHQACQELEGDRDRNLARIAELERQTAEMQEQVLSQAQQASEYETAVQHWKDRFQSAQDKVVQLKVLLESAELPAAVGEVLEAIQALVPPEPLSRPASARTTDANPDLKLDLPDFLTRRRYRNRPSLKGDSKES